MALQGMFYVAVSGEWVNCGKTVWSGLWCNPFDSLGVDEAACIPFPLMKAWHQPTYDYYTGGGRRDPVFDALDAGDIQQVKGLIKTPEDMLRWEADGVDGCHRFVLERAFCAMNVAVLQYLLELSPLHFMQQILMVNGQYAYTKFTPIAAAIAKGQHKDESKLCECLQWVCDSGVMTDSVLSGSVRGETAVGPDEEPISEFARGKAQQILRDWSALPDRERAGRTRDCFVALLGECRVVTCSLKQTNADGSLSILCTGLSGDELATLSCHPDKSTAELRASLAELLALPAYRVRLVSQAGQHIDIDAKLSEWAVC